MEAFRSSDSEESRFRPRFASSTQQRLAQGFNVPGFGQCYYAVPLAQDRFAGHNLRLVSPHDGGQKTAARQVELADRLSERG